MQIGKLIRANRIKKFYREYIVHKDKVLDLGCGDGKLAIILMNKIGKDIELHFSDVEKRDLNNFTTIKNYQLPFADGYFNVVMLNDVLHHVPFDKQMLLVREAKRIGKIVLICETSNSWLARLLDEYNNINNDYPLLDTQRSYEDWLKVFKIYDGEAEVIRASPIHPIRNYLFMLK